MTAWHALDAREVLARLATSETGLSSAEAARRLAETGRNELEGGPGLRPLAILVAQFQSLLVWLLIGAALVSGVLRDWVDCIVILAIVALNAGIGFVQECRAERALLALRKMTAPQARVLRDGKGRLVPAAEVVPGDVIELDAGDLVPADARLLTAAQLQTNEAPLTGESAPVEKACIALPEARPLAERRTMLYMGTSVTTGSGSAVVVATARATELGQIAALLGGIGEEQTPLQKRLAAFGRVLAWASLGTVALVFVLGLARGEPLLTLFLTSVSLAVAAVPEGLPAIVTVALAVGVQRMARRRALVRRMHAVETLGSTTVICSDKTGTLTVGEMTVRELATLRALHHVGGEGYAPEGAIELAEGSDRDDAALRQLLTALVGCNGARLVQTDGRWSALGDPTEAALLVAGAKASVHPPGLAGELPEVLRFPFDSDRKRMTVVRRRSSGAFVALVKGAPDVLLALCTHALAGDRVVPMTGELREQIHARNTTMAARGLRVLAAAERALPAEPDARTMAEVERELVFLGLVGMQDPPRAEAKRAVAQCRSAGIRVVMITGDQAATALAIARELGIATENDEALTGGELERMSDPDLASRARRVAVYARVTAAHKLRIVHAEQANGAVVAMTGDGVNDAPAIKGADIGIAMGRSGTEVTKEASDMIITDDDFATIVAAVEEGRGVYANIKKTLQYLLAGNCGELLLMTACVAVGLPVPLLAVHLLWINLVTDGLPALCLATDPIDPDVMRCPPRGREERMADRAFLIQMLVTGVLTADVSFTVYVIALRGEDEGMARAHAFGVLVFAELFRAFGCRSETKLVTEVGIATNLKLLVVVLVSAALQLAAPHLPWLAAVLRLPAMPLAHCLWLALAGAIPLVVLEIWKVLRRSRSEQ